MQVREGYKQTEAGVIPEDWNAKPLLNVAPLQRGFDLPTTQLKHGMYPVVYSNGVLNFHNKAMVLAPGVVTGRSGTIGKVNYIEADYWPHNTTLWVTSFKDNDPKFIYYLYEDIKLNRFGTGSGVPTLNRNDVHSFRVAVPPLAEQRAIATALSDVDALLAAQDKFIAKKRDIKQAAMQQLLTGKQRLPGFSGEWEVKRLGDVLSRMANGAVYKATTSFGVCITRIETISDGTIDYSRTGTAVLSTVLDKYKLLSGDILFSHINSLDHIGKVALFDGPRELYHGMNLLLLRASENMSSKFLYFWLTSEPARRKARNLAKQAVSQASINTTELKDMEISMPQLSEQTAIAAVLSDMDADLAALEQQRDKTRSLKQGMMQELLTGRIRLV